MNTAKSRPFDHHRPDEKHDDEYADDTTAFETVIPTPSASASLLSAEQLRRRITHRAIAYLSRREYSRAELQRKLHFAFAEQLFSPDEQSMDLNALIDSVLNQLADKHWQSDQRYAHAVGKSKGERYGVARIKYALQQQGIDEEIVNAAVNELTQNEAARAHAVWQKKFGTLPSNPREYAKQSRFLAYRGFSFDTIKQVLKGDLDELSE